MLIWTKYGFFFLVPFATILMYNIFNACRIMQQVRDCGTSISMDSIVQSDQFMQLISEMRSKEEILAFVLLNRFATEMTLNWLCNVEWMDGVQNRTVFVTLDEEAERRLLTIRPTLRTFSWPTPCLHRAFRPGDAIYLSFFLFRTNFIRALLQANRPFWMLQADTFWNSDLLSLSLERLHPKADVLLDQQGHEFSAESRRGQMNGANFLVYPTPATALLFSRLAWLQSYIYVTDADAINSMCYSKSGFDCRYIPYRFVSGWEWVYGRQTNPPSAIQMDGETEGGKEETMKNYGLWFLNEDNATCRRNSVTKARVMVNNSQVPRLYSLSKNKQKWLLAIGQFLTGLPVVGNVYRQYGGFVSMYLQFF